MGDIIEQEKDYTLVSNMPRDANSGRSPFENLREHFDESLVCPECGYHDEDGEWTASASGDRVVYRHECPSCGHEHRRTLRSEAADESDGK